MTCTCTMPPPPGDTHTVGCRYRARLMTPTCECGGVIGRHKPPCSKPEAWPFLRPSTWTAEQRAAAEPAMAAATVYEWTDSAGLNTIEVRRASEGRYMLSVGHGPEGQRTTVSVALPYEAVDGLHTALDLNLA